MVCARFPSPCRPLRNSSSTALETYGTARAKMSTMKTRMTNPLNGFVTCQTCCSRGMGDWIFVATDTHGRERRSVVDHPVHGTQFASIGETSPNPGAAVVLRSDDPQAGVDPQAVVHAAGPVLLLHDTAQAIRSLTTRRRYRTRRAGCHPFIRQSSTAAEMNVTG